MARPLNALQQVAYDTVKREGSIKKGDGWTLGTARALAARDLVRLTERKDAQGTTYFWKAALPPAAPVLASSSAPQPAGAHVARVGVRNPQTGAVTFTEVRHVPDVQALRTELGVLGVPVRHQLQGRTGDYITDDGRRKTTWCDLGDGALREFVCGGEVYRVQPHVAVPDLWAVVHLASGETVCADADPAEAERDAREDAAAFHHALRRSQ